MPLSRDMHRILLITCLLAAAPALADPAATLPVSLADSLRPVREVNLDDLDVEARSSIQLARRQLNTALQSYPVQPGQLATAYGELGGLYQVHFVFPAAEDCYQNAMQLAPDAFRWAYYAAYLSDINGRTQEALKRYQHARTLKPGYKALTIRLGNILLDLNELEQAQTAFEQVMDAAGLEAAALYGLGQIALLRRDYGKAIASFTRALEYDPAASSIHYPLAQALRATRRNAEAKAQLALRGKLPPSFRDPQIERLEALKIGSRIHFIQAMKAIKRQDYAAAGKAFAQGLESEPGNVLARISYARTLYLNGDTAAARKVLQAALGIDPENPLGLFLLGVLTEEQGDSTGAAAYYQRVIHHEPDHAGANFYLGNQYYRQQDYTAAARHYAGSLKGEPDNLAAFIPYVNTLLLGNAPDATLMEVLATGIDRFPEYPGFRALQIMLLACSNAANISDPKAALQNAQQLNERLPAPPHRELLALALAANGDFEQAITIQERLLAFTRQNMPAGTKRVEQTLADYREGRCPSLDELIDRTALQAPPFDASAPLRNYPAPRPYN